MYIITLLNASLCEAIVMASDGPGGFFLVHRGWRDCHLFKGEYSRADAWIWLIENACWKPTPYNVKGKTIMLERGQVCASRRQLAKAWGWSPSAVERFLQALISEQMIARETGKNPDQTGQKPGQDTGPAPGQDRSVITLCNYDKFQGEIKAGGQDTGPAPGQGTPKSRTIKEQENKLTRDTEPKGSISKRVKEVEAVVPDWMPIEAWAGFLEMRRRIKKPATARAQQLLIAKLEQMDRAGQNIAAVLDQSTMSNWQGIFEVKDQRNGKRINDNDEPQNPYLAAIASREASRSSSEW